MRFLRSVVPPAAVPAILVAALIASGALADTPVESSSKRGTIETVGIKFQVNTETSGSQNLPAIAKNGDGRFVIVWEDRSTGSRKIKGQLYTSDGTPDGSEFMVNEFSSGNQSDPAVTMDPDGDFVVVWEGDGDDDANGIHGRLFSSDGVPIGNDFLVNTGNTTGTQQDPSIASRDDGDFVVVWRDRFQTAGQRFTSDGTGAGEITIHSDLDDSFPSVAMNSSGAFIVAWQGATKGGLNAFRNTDKSAKGPIGVGSPLEAQRFASDGSEVGSSFQVNNLPGYQYRPSPGIADNGQFAIAWESYSGRGSYDVVAKLYDSAGMSVSGQFQINSGTSAYAYAPSLGMKPNGDFIVAWTSYDADRPINSGRRFASDGTLVGAEFGITTSTTPERDPVVGVDSHNLFVVAWQSGDSKYGGDDGDDAGIFAQRFNFCDDSDLDEVCNVDDICEGSDDNQDIDRDGVPDGCDICALGDDNDDADKDGVPDACDICALGDDNDDADKDGVPDACDICGLGDDNDDADKDGVPDACDICALGDDNDDADKDGVPDACDICALGDDNDDADKDGVPDACDVCALGDDNEDADKDGVPDACDICALGDDNDDADKDGVPDACDICDLGDDNEDDDMDTVPDACDVCPGGDDRVDTDMDGIPDDCEDIIPPTVTLISSNPDTGNGELNECEQVRFPISQLTVTFNEAMNAAQAADTSNFLLVAAGPDGSIDTISCAAPSVDDVLVPIIASSYDDPSNTATVSIRSRDDVQRLLVCGNLEDEQGNAIGADVVRGFRIDTQNLFGNGHFDCDLSGWELSPPGGNIAADSEDILSSNVSGSAAFDEPFGDGLGVSQCTEISPRGLSQPVDMDLSASVLLAGTPDSSILAQRRCELFSAATCAGDSVAVLSAADQIVLETDNTWLTFEDPLTFSAGTVSARCSFDFTKLAGTPIALLDEALLKARNAQAAEIFSDGFESGDLSAWSETFSNSLSMPLTEENR